MNKATIGDYPGLPDGNDTEAQPVRMGNSVPIGMPIQGEAVG